MDSSLPLPHPSDLSTSTALPSTALSSAELPSTGSMPGRFRVFVGIWWRSLIVAIVGGAVIGALVALPWYFIADDMALGDVGLFAYFGGGFGFVLGFVAGAIVGGLSSALLVPYRNAEHCLKVVRVTACVLVGLGVGLMLLPIPLMALGAVVLGVGGAFFTAPWIIGWYIRRCEVAEQL